MKNQIITIRKTELIILILSLFLAVLRSSILRPFFINTESFFSMAWVEIGIWILTAAFIVHLLQKDAVWEDFIAQWCKERILIAFLGFAIFSIFWSISFSASLYRTSILVLSSFAGAYIGYKYGVRRLLDVLFWFGAIVVISSYWFSLFAPSVSVMYGHPYYGSWRGIFWHRNHLGAITALINIVFLIRMLAEFRNRLKMLTVDALFYFLSLILVYFARSAAGYILTLILHFSVVTAIAWLRFSHRLKRIHYIAISGITIIGVVFVFSNLSFFFGMFNRATNLTGRIPMWDYLLKNVVNQSPWIGYGFGAIWTIPSFLTGLQHVQGWPGPIMIGDNGFMDILLYIGIIGLVIFLGLWSRMWIVSFQHGIRQHSLLDVFPLVLMIFTLFANITFSLFLETETFVWLTMTAILFAIEKTKSVNEQTSES